jgi:hypothetical protein
MNNKSTWKIETLRNYTVQRIDDLVTLLDERYRTQSKAIDAAFEVQQIAMKTAFEAADKAVQAALAASKEASAKAEEASDKRFASVNEFRGQLADQAATLIGRAEYAVQHKALEDKVVSLADRVVQLELRLTSRLDLATGTNVGSRQSEGDIRQNTATIAQWIAMALIGIGVLVSVAIALLKH